jgi:predicted RNA-binding Zn-ribbon protein involved in translation (DUF1610 family)
MLAGLSKGEQRRLSSDEADWNLAGRSSAAVLSRTRGGGNGIPDLESVMRKKSIGLDDEVVDLVGDEQSKVSSLAGDE